MLDKLNDNPVIGVLLGDAAGCGPEIVARLAADGALSNGMRPLLIGDIRIFEQAQRFARTSVPVTEISTPAEANWTDTIPFLNLGNLDPSSFEIGQVSAECGRAVGETLTKAITLALEGTIDGVFYAPLHKQALYEGGFTFESEAEMFASLMPEAKQHGEINIVGDLWTTRVTSHIPLKEVSEALSIERIRNTVEFGFQAMRQAGLAKPRLAVAALNPHAGENGKCGMEEIEIVAPAVDAAASGGIDVKGPFPADTVFARAFAGEFDMVVTLYHDQGQIALKTRNFGEGVTVAGGFAVPICTPGHGTAFDKAGSGTAKTTAAKNALEVCRSMSATRRVDML